MRRVSGSVEVKRPPPGRREGGERAKERGRRGLKREQGERRSRKRKGKEKKQGRHDRCRDALLSIPIAITTPPAGGQTGFAVAKGESEGGKVRSKGGIASRFKQGGRRRYCRRRRFYPLFSHIDRPRISMLKATPIALNTGHTPASDPYRLHCNDGGKRKEPNRLVRQRIRLDRQAKDGITLKLTWIVSCCCSRPNCSRSRLALGKRHFPFSRPPRVLPSS